VAYMEQALVALQHLPESHDTLEPIFPPNRSIRSQLSH